MHLRKRTDFREFSRALGLVVLLCYDYVECGASLRCAVVCLFVHLWRVRLLILV